MIFTVTLATRDLMEGWSLMKDSVPLGKEYHVDTDTMRIAIFVNLARKISARFPVILELDDAAYLPIHILKFPKDALLHVDHEMGRLGYKRDGANEEIH